MTDAGQTDASAPQPVSWPSHSDGITIPMRRTAVSDVANELLSVGKAPHAPRSFRSDTPQDERERDEPDRHQP